MSARTPTISIVAPVYNEAAGIAAFHARLHAVAAGLGDVEIVYVDDGSTDGSWKELLAIGADDPSARLIRLSRNFGHQIALTAGLEAARGRAVITIDSDLQDPPELIPELVSRWHEGFEVVHAVRTERAGERRWRLFAIGAYYRVLGRIAGTDIPAQSGDFRLFSRRALDALGSMPERARYLRGMASWIGFHQTTVPYAREPRAAGGTKYPLRKLVHLGADGILSFSTVPLKLVSILGGILVVFCSAVLAWSLYTRLFTSHYPAGWTSVIAVVLLLGGVQLLSLGVIGQYVARIFDEAKGRPLYFVAETVESQGALQAAPAAERSPVT